MIWIEMWTVVAACGVVLSAGMVYGADGNPVTDRLDKAERYYSLHPGFEKAFAFLRRPDLAHLAPGKYSIDGEKVFCTISKGPGKKKSEAQLERHRKYIDIQFIIAGMDEMGWKPSAQCHEVSAAYDATKDIMFFKDPPQKWIKVPANSFIIYFPKDAHAPMVSEGQVHKAVVKVMTNDQ